MKSLSAHSCAKYAVTSVAGLTLLAMATVVGSCPERSQSDGRAHSSDYLFCRLGDRSRQHVPDQSLRSVWTAPGISTKEVHLSRFPQAGFLQIRAPSDYARLHHRSLGDAEDDCGSSRFCDCYDSLHSDCDSD